MQSHFSSFTPEAMRAFGQQLNEDLESRKQYIESIRRSTNEMLAESHRKQQESEALRRQSARQDADNRRVHFSELRSEVRSFCNRVELKRKDVVADLQHLRQELNSASMAFRNRGSN